MAQTSGGGQTLTFRELDKGSRFDYIDNAPRNKHNRRPVFSVGDEFVLANPLADASGKIGELRALCTITKKAPGNDNGLNAGRPFCTGVFVLKTGTLFVETTDAGTRTTQGGGRRRHRRLRGRARDVHLDDYEERLERRGEPAALTGARDARGTSRERRPQPAWSDLR